MTITDNIARKNQEASELAAKAATLQAEAAQLEAEHEQAQIERAAKKEQLLLNYLPGLSAKELKPAREALSAARQAFQTAVNEGGDTVTAWRAVIDTHAALRVAFQDGRHLRHKRDVARWEDAVTRVADWNSAIAYARDYRGATLGTVAHSPLIPEGPAARIKAINGEINAYCEEHGYDYRREENSTREFNALVFGIEKPHTSMSTPGPADLPTYTEAIDNALKAYSSSAAQRAQDARDNTVANYLAEHLDS